MDVALNYYLSHYDIGSVHRSLTQAIMDGKIYIGEEGNTFNYFKRDFQELSNMHRELTLIYGPIHSFQNYENVNSIGANNLFQMFVDFSVFFEYLYENNTNVIVVEKEGQYIRLYDLTDETHKGLDMIAEITGELETIRSESYDSQTSGNKEALKDYLVKAGDYFNTPDVQMKYQSIQHINKGVVTKSNY